MPPLPQGSLRCQSPFCLTKTCDEKLLLVNVAESSRWWSPVNSALADDIDMTQNACELTGTELVSS